LGTAVILLPAFWTFGQSIGQFDPWELAIHVYVSFRRQANWVVQAGRRNADFIRKVAVLEYQLGAAAWAETPCGLRGRFESVGFSAHDPEL
jgi:hypothetical protein